MAVSESGGVKNHKPNERLVASVSPANGMLLPVDGLLSWWSWGESNPRPKAFVRQIYTLS